MRSLLPGGALMVCAAALMANGARAQDAAMPDWTGAYLGVHGTWTHSQPGFDNGDVNDPATDYRFHDDGFGAGVYLGHDWQSGPYVVGVAADYDYLNLSDQERQSIPLLGKGDEYNYDLDWAASARLRGGHLFEGDRMLVYGTAGVAFTSVEASTAYVDGGTVEGQASVSQFKTGAVFGGGVEFAFAPNWTFKTEYLRYEFGKVELGGGSSNTTRISFEPSFDQVKFGIAYRF